MAIKVLNEFLPEAEQVRLGGVKVGDTLSIDNGVLNTNSENTGIGGNRLTSVPDPFSVSVVDGTLTVGINSKIYIPNGFESDETTRHFDEYILTKNYTRSDTTLTPSTKYEVVYDRQEDGLRLRLFDYTASGAIMPTSAGDWIWYDTTSNKIKAVSDGAVLSDDCSLPLAIIKTDTTGGIERGEQAFDSGFGFIGSEVFCLPGVHGTYPWGTDNNRLPVSYNFIVQRVLTATTNLQNRYLQIYVNASELILSDEYYYDSGVNFNRYIPNNRQLLNAAKTQGAIETNENGSIKKLANTARVYATAYERAPNASVDYSYIDATWLSANRGRAINNSINSNGALVAFDRYKSQNGVFLARGYNTTYGITYTSDSTITGNTNGYTHNLVLLDESGNSAFPGNIAAAGTVQAPATSAYWADLAEKYESDVKYPIGTLVCFGGDKEITIAKKNVNGIISEKPGYTLNSKSKGLPVALVGKTKVRVIGKINKNDKLVLYKDGIARKKKWYDVFKTVIGITLESNNNLDEKLVMSVVRLAI